MTGWLANEPGGDRVLSPVAEVRELNLNLCRTEGHFWIARDNQECARCHETRYSTEPLSIERSAA